MRHQPAAPRRRAFRARRQIAGFAGAGKAETHRHDRDLSRVVEHVARNAEPAPQPLAAGFVERHAGFVDLVARCPWRAQDLRDTGPGAPGDRMKTLPNSSYQCAYGMPSFALKKKNN